MKTHTSLILCAAVLAVLGLAWMTPAQADLVAYYDFDEALGATTFADSVGTYDGTVLDPRNTGAGLGAEGQFGNAIQLTADPKVGSRGVVPSALISDNDLGGANARTFSMWFNTPDWNSGTDPGIQLISYGCDGPWDPGAVFMLTLQQWDGQSRITPMVIDRGHWGDNTSVGALDTWNHIVVAYDAASNFSTMRIYVNGVDLAAPVKVDGSDPVLNTNVRDLGIGGTADGGWTNYDGRIDDLGVWNEALNAGKAISMYNILSPNGGTLDDYTVDKMNTLFQAYDTGTSQAVTSDAGILGWEKFTGASGTPGEVTYSGGVYSVFFDNTSGVRTPASVWDADTGTPGAQDGDGFWRNGEFDWWDESANVAWDDTKKSVAVFGAASATADPTVAVDTVVIAGGIVFNDASGYTYTLTGGSITLEGGATVEANVDARIESAIDGTAGLTKAGTGTLEVTGANTYTGGVAVTGGTLVGDTGSILGDVTLSNGSNVTFNQGSDDVYAGKITGDGSFAKTGAGTLALTFEGEHAYTGDATVSGGTLRVAESCWLPWGSTVTVEAGGTLGGTGRTAAIDLLRGGTLAPGESAGTLYADGNVALGAGAAYEWEVDDLDGTAGIDWDLLDINGCHLTVSATSGDPFGIKVISLDPLGDPGAAAGTLEAGDSFEIVAEAAGIDGFSAEAFTIDTSAFLNPMGSLEFVVAARTGSLYLDVLAPPLWDADTGAADAQDGDGTWSDGGGNWWNGPGNVAWDNTKADVATFGAANAGADLTVTVDAVTAGGIVFNDANGYRYTLTGGTITLEGAPTIEANVAATHVIASDVVLADALDIDVAELGTLVFEGLLDNSAGQTITKTGDGTLVINGPQDHAPATVFEILGGTVDLNTAAGGAGTANLSVLVDDAVLHFGCNQYLDTLTLQNGALVRFTGANVVVLNHLVMNGLDLGGVTLTPEPATLALVAAGLAALVVRKRKT